MPTQPANTPCVLLIRDGWGRNPHPEHDAFNAVKLANTPAADALERDWPTTLIKTSGEDVGLTDATMGNSEVGHQNLGAGRVVDQDAVRITKSIRTGDFFTNEALTNAVASATSSGGAIHLMGIASDAGVHGRLDHLYACLELCKRLGAADVYLHLFTDGRDTGPFTGAGYIAQIESKCAKLGVGCVASVIGRYYAMDRDNRWERVHRAHACLTGRDAETQNVRRAASSAEAVQRYYDAPDAPNLAGDEFIPPTIINDAPRIADGDAVVFYNYRGDRPREICRALLLPNFHNRVPPSPDTGAKGFDRGDRLDLRFVAMTAYAEDLLPYFAVAFPRPPKMKNIAGEAIAELGLPQFRCAETEKYPHVTFFFNDYRDDPFPGEERAIIQSPRVATYDLQPEMSAAGVRDAVLERLRSDNPEPFIVVNFANPDMVGHTGNLDAAIKACEFVDQCVAAIVEQTLAVAGSLIVTADHGNAEMMRDPETNAPHTAHTTFDVPLHVVGAPFRNATLRENGRLADVIPTMLHMMNLPQPPEMTGESLLA